MASKNAQIEKVFSNALRTWSAVQVVDVATKGYEPVSGSCYVAQSLIPSVPQTVFVGRTEKQRFTGIYQIDVYSSTENAEYDADQLIESLESTFKTGYPVIYGSLIVQITNVSVQPLGLEEGWYRAAISIYYTIDM